MRVSDLEGAALDWAVARANGIPARELYISGSGKYQSLFRRNIDEDGNLDGSYTTGPDLLYSRKWEAGGPIIEREEIQLSSTPYSEGYWCYAKCMGQLQECDGPTPLIAAMRCYVASKLGDEVNIPKELK